MLAKYGFAIMVAVFGALMFAAGLMAPESLRHSVASVSITAGSGISDSPAVKLSASGNGMTPPVVAASSEKDEPILMESLMVPMPAPEKGPYALQVGQFASADVAADYGLRIKKQGLPFDKVLRTVDQQGSIWFIVAIGPYPNQDAARLARLNVSQDLGIEGGLPMILLPPAAPAPAPKT